MQRQADLPGLLVDAGAVKPFTGSVLVRSQVKRMQQRCFGVVWQDLPVPEFMRAIGRDAHKYSRAPHLVRALHDGKLVGYSSPVLAEDPASFEAANVPPLYG